MEKGPSQILGTAAPLSIGCVSYLHKEYVNSEGIYVLFDLQGVSELTAGALNWDLNDALILAGFL